MSADIPLIFVILLFIVAFNCLCVQSQKHCYATNRLPLRLFNAVKQLFDLCNQVVRLTVGFAASDTFQLVDKVAVVVGVVLTARCVCGRSFLFEVW